jgi:Cu-Zn family superoxide dismutase
MKNCGGNIFAFHVHAGGSCSGTPEDPFENTGAHYNPQGCEHPEHAGDLPPLFENNGYAYSVFFTDRFTAEESIGRTAIIHSLPDDFHTQPSGNSGKKIACGEIKRNL